MSAEFDSIVRIKDGGLYILFLFYFSFLFSYFKLKMHDITYYCHKLSHICHMSNNIVTSHGYIIIYHRRTKKILE